jgi:hypothetical protein
MGKRKNRNNLKCNRVRIYHHILDLEYHSHSTYLIETETIDHIPVRTYYFKVPESYYKENRVIDELEEMTYPYCPN